MTSLSGTGPPASPGAQRYLLGVWIFMSVLTPLLGFLGARGFAPAVGVMGLLCLPLARPRGSDWIGLALLAALVAWAWVSVLWSPAPFPESLKAIGRFTGLHLLLQLVLSGAFIIATRRLDGDRAEASLRWLGYGLMALATILVVEGFTQAGVYQALQGIITEKVRPDLAVRNVAVGGYVVATLIWPAAVTLWRRGRRLRVGALALAVAFSTVFLRGDSPTIALVISAMAFFAVFKGGRAAVLAMGAIAAVYFVSMPWVMLGLEKGGVFAALRDHLPLSWRARMDIWSFANARILEDPMRGWGLDASRMFVGYIKLHPHDGAVQAWLELGLPGAVIAATFWFFLFRRIAEDADEGQGRLFAATACATATVYLVIGAISFSLWQEWWICLGTLAMAACVALRRVTDRPKPLAKRQASQQRQAA